jgi:hypothetical protein|tara:strand:+ start:974 stop:1186 length:213 start_codon:yes stop_codon:yes gene_type:complete
MISPYYIEAPITQRKIEVPEEILYYCDDFTYDADRDDLRYIDCVYMHMGEYGNDPKMLEELRKAVRPIFE